VIRRFGDARDWFFEHRFGMFVHWGLYAIPAWHEQILWRGGMSRQEYEKLASRFDPARYDPDAWIDAMQEAGMEYLCFTTKHHDGFCMWDSRFTEYKVTNTAYGKDVLASLAQACARRGVSLGLYYSLPDWHHPNYPNLGRHHEMFGPRAGDEPDEGRYLEYVRNQLRELCTGYGQIRQLFWDLNVAEFHDPSLNDMARELQPGILINDRGPGPGDYSTPERHVPEGREFGRPTEACQSMGRESWGYREDEDYYSTKFLIQSMDRIFAMGGSYLLNVGPRGDGTLPPECREGLRRIGKWYRVAREAVEGTTPCSSMLAADRTDLFAYDELLMTRRGNTFFVHIAEELQTSGVVLECFERMPRSATLLNTGQSLDFVVDTLPWRWRKKPCLRLRGLPVNSITDEPLIVRLEFGEDAVR
jgi:alpha-L-fucosidase